MLIILLGTTMFCFNCIGRVMVSSVLALHAGGPGSNPGRVGQYNVSEWGDMSSFGLLL